ncbi:MAG: deoxyguanosinetriphosphate triphosphohydrolase, partial [Eubacterium sp.]|nr:deoxyguanosinetriphosphate triphosphohydrolase [Eubacterium sp.]
NADETHAGDLLHKIYSHYINHIDDMPQIYSIIAEKDGRERAVCDYIAGMSDVYALKIFNQLFVPMFWHD